MQFITTVQATNVRLFLIVDSLCFFGSAVQRSWIQCNIICWYALAKRGDEGGGERMGGEEGELGLERCRGGIHVLGPATMGCARKGDGRSVWLVTAGQSAWRGEGKLGGRRPLQKGRGGDSKYNEYSEQPHKSAYTVLAFLLYVSLRIGSINTGRPHSDITLGREEEKRDTNDNFNPREVQVHMWEVEAVEDKEQD